MPNRLLREGICTSDAINSLTAEEEVLFCRLLVVADDFGYMDARPAIVKAECFPLRDTVTPAKVEAWLVALAGAGLIVRYQSGGKPYLAIAKWEHRIRSRQKYPGPQDDGSSPLGSEPHNPVSTMPQVVSSLLTERGQVSADCGLGKGKGKGKGATLTPLPDGWFPKPETQASIAAKFSLSDAEVSRYVDAFRDACAAKGYRYADFDAAFRNCVVQDWPRLRVGKVAPTADGKPRLAI